MDGIIHIKKKLIELESVLPSMLAEVFTEIASEVEDANILQLQKGQRGDGSFLPDYSPASVNRFGKPPGPIRLFDEGDFYRGIILKVFPNGIELQGRDIKTDMLQHIYGEGILDLTEESLERLKQDFVLELLQEKVERYLLAA